MKEHFANPAAIIRILITIGLLVGVYFETGPLTVFTLCLVVVSIELMTITSTNINKAQELILNGMKEVIDQFTVQESEVTRACRQAEELRKRGHDG